MIILRFLFFSFTLKSFLFHLNRDFLFCDFLFEVPFQNRKLFVHVCQSFSRNRYRLRARFPEICILHNIIEQLFYCFVHSTRGLLLIHDLSCHMSEPWLETSLFPRSDFKSLCFCYENLAAHDCCQINTKLDW